MNEETYGALQRIVREVKEKRKAKCIWIDCVVNHMIGGDDIDLVEKWIKETEGEEEMQRCSVCQYAVCECEV